MCRLWARFRSSSGYCSRRIQFPLYLLYNDNHLVGYEMNAFLADGCCASNLLANKTLAP